MDLMILNIACLIPLYSAAYDNRYILKSNENTSNTGFNNTAKPTNQVLCYQCIPPFSLYEGCIRECVIFEVEWNLYERLFEFRVHESTYTQFVMYRHNPLSHVYLKSLHSSLFHISEFVEYTQSINRGISGLFWNTSLEY